MSGRDVIGIAQTGSGKTLAYTIPSVLNILKSTNNSLTVKRLQPPISLIILPTRELCKQVSDEYFKFAYSIGIRVATVYGGEGKIYQTKQIQSGVHAIIGTPGRMLDLINQDILNINNVKFLVLDEADLMFDMGFEEQIRRVIASMSDSKQTLMFTATWPKEIQALAQEFLINPVKVKIGDTDLTMNKDIQHKFISVSANQKYQTLLDLISKTTEGKILIFANTKNECDELLLYLKNNDIKSDCLHSGRDQMIRNLILRDFKGDKNRILIATDVASRGLDIKNIDLVVNFSLPRFFDDYIHRVGRTGRAGAKGVAFSLVTYQDNKGVLTKIKTALNKIGQSLPQEIDELTES